MADLKEETTVENTQEAVAPKKKFDTSFEGLQLYYEQNKKVVTYVGGGLLALIAGFLYFKLSWLPEKEAEAVNELFWPQTYFEKDSFNVALNGGAMVMSPDGQKQMMGFAAIADEYGITESGNLANFYAGICLLQTKRYDEAIEYLKKYNGSDNVASALAFGAIGDANLELKRHDDAIKYYLKAADRRKNSFTSPYFLKKAGIARELSADYAGAVESYERILREYPESTEGREIERDIARVETLGNL
jgi:tetratricopeptide (TPR) repeat protein